MFKCLPLLLAALWLPVLPSRALPQTTVTIGDPARPETLPAALQSAYDSGARHIVIRPGTYTLPNVGHAVFSLNGWKDAVVSASSVALVQTDLAGGHNTFDLVGCVRVTLEGATLTQTEVTHYQGRVLAVGTDASGKAFCDWRPDLGYPVPPVGMTEFPSALNVVDAQTRLLKIGVGDFYHRPMEAQGGGVFRVHFDGLAPCVPGDWVVGRYKPAGPFKVFLNNSTGCTLRDLTLLRNGFAAIREADGGGNRLLACRWLPGPPPDGAAEKPLVCDAADGLHSTGANPGPDIEDCTFQGVLLDDCLAIHGKFQTVQSAAGRTLTVDGTAKFLAAGQPLRLSDKEGFYAEAIAIAVRQNPDQTTTVTLDKDLAVPVGAKLSSPARAGAGYKIIHCQIGGTRSRGILAKADNGLIQNNSITGCGQAAVSVGPEYSWNEADYVHNVVIAGNSITGCGFVGYGGAAVWVHGDGAMGNANIVVKNNTLRDCYAGGVQINWTNGATLSGNTFVGADTRPPSLLLRSPIILANCRAIVLSGNMVTTPVLYPSVLVTADTNVEGVTHNDATGIQTAAR